VESPQYAKFKFEEKYKKFQRYSDALNQDSFCVVDLDVELSLINQANTDINEAIEKRAIKVNSRAYHYNANPRIVEAWKFSNSIKALSINKTILDVLRFSYQSEPIPFSTINFIKGTEQPLHSDEIHFGSIPHRYLAGCWIALQDIDPDSGPLSIVVGSHKLPIFSFEQIGLSTPRNESDFKKSYSIYEEWVKKTIKTNKLDIVTPKLKKGQCIIWLSNALHGAYAIKNSQLTRRSLVVHYHFEKCKKLFYPSYSNLKMGKLIPRTLKNLDIRKQNPELWEVKKHE
jgi:ectoine hydroxylase-related dioxygenase (phytanoyl-CoA dioxygenase family)